MKLVILIIYLFFVSCGVDNKTEGEIVARVGHETLTKENLLFLAGNRSGDLDFFSRIESLKLTFFNKNQSPENFQN